MASNEQEQKEIDKLRKLHNEQLSKASKGLDSLSSALNGNTGSLSSALKGVSPEVSLAVSGIELYANAMKMVANITINSTRSMADLNTQLKQMGSTDVNESLTEANNSLNNITNTIKEMSTTLESYIVEAFNNSGLSDVIENILKSANDKIKDDSPAKTGSAAQDAIVKVALDDYGIDSKTSIDVLNNIENSLRVLGFSDNYRNTASTAWYNTALDVAKKNGISDSDGVKKVAEALINGNGAQYGINNSDNALYGWLYQTKGINPYAVNINEAKMNSYREEYTYMLTYSEKSTAQMEKQIQQWMELNSLIKNAQNGLYGFEMIIQQSAVDNEIPDEANGNLINNRDAREADTNAKKTQTYLDKIKQYRKELKQALDDGIIDEKTYKNISTKLDRLELEVKYAEPETLGELESEFVQLDDLFKTIGDSTIDPDIRFESIQKLNQELDNAIKSADYLNDMNGRTDENAYQNILNKNGWSENPEDDLAKLQGENKGNANFDGNKYTSSNESSGNILEDLWNNNSVVKTFKNTDGNLTQKLLRSAGAYIFGTQDGWSTSTIGSALDMAEATYNTQRNIANGDSIIKAVADGITEVFTGNKLSSYIENMNSGFNGGLNTSVSNKVGKINSPIGMSSSELSNFANLVGQKEEYTDNSQQTITNNFNINGANSDPKQIANLVIKQFNQSVRTNNGKVGTTGIKMPTGLTLAKKK